MGNVRQLRHVRAILIQSKVTQLFKKLLLKKYLKGWRLFVIFKGN